MALINAYSNSDGDFYFAIDSSRSNYFSQDGGWSRAAPLFDSYSGANSAKVYRLVNDDIGAISYSRDFNEIRERVSQGWKNDGEAFQVGSRPSKGLKAIHEMYRDDDTSYVYVYGDELIGSLESSGYRDQGIAWYSPVNDGLIRIKNHKIDPVTGVLSVKYELDELHLSQFREFENVLTFRLVGTDLHEQVVSADIGSKDIRYKHLRKKSGLTSGVINVDLGSATGRDFRELSDVSLSINSKYGKSKDSPDSSFGFARTTVLHLNGESLGNSFTTNSGDIADSNHRNLFSLTIPRHEALLNMPGRDVKPGGYYINPYIENQNLRGSDWSKVTMTQAHIINNDLSASSLASASFDARIEIVDDSGNTVTLPSLLYKNDMKDVNLEGFRYYFNKEVAADYGREQNLISGYQGEIGAIVDESDYKVARMIITNKSMQDIKIEMGSPQFALIQDLKPGETKSLWGSAFADWEGGYWAAGRHDIYAVVTTPLGGRSGVLSVYNGFGPASFYINNEAQDDDGSSGNLSWRFNDDSAYKEWSIVVS